METGNYEQVLDRVLQWSRARDYRGYNKHDGLNSPVLACLLGWGRWPRLIAIQGVMRAPVNPRALLLTPRTLNPKGLALFAQSWLTRHRFNPEPAGLEAALELLSVLHGLRRVTASGSGWGYPYPWQDPAFHAPRHTPNAVVTCFVCEAYMDAFEITKRAELLDPVTQAVAFLTRDLTVLKQTPDELCLSYMPMPMSMRVMDVSILIGAVLARYGTLTGTSEYTPQARRLVNYVVHRQTEYGAWYYTDPPADSLITHDNYHTGFILDALWRCMEYMREDSWREVYRQGLRFYRDRLFTPEGAPRWMHDRDFPHDVHGAAQGVITFARHQDEEPGFARRVLDWTLANLYEPEGRFGYQVTRWYRKRFTLMRWCNAWMCRALSQYIAHAKAVSR
jgi:hypothetical protein